MNDGRSGIEGNRDDPGWRRSLVGLFILMPGISLVLAQRRAGRVDGLVLLRTLYLSFVSSLVAIAGVVLVILGVTPGRRPPRAQEPPPSSSCSSAW